MRERYEHFRSRCTQDELMQKTMHNDESKEDLTTKNILAKDPNKDSTKKSESGCTESLHGKKSKCIINIVPQEDKRDSFQMHKKCLKTRKNS